MISLKKVFLYLFLIIFIQNSVFGQKYPKGYFRNPMDIPLEIAGSFGELRPNHFHSGIDIRTHGKEGLPVYATADGWLSRVNVSGRGYGNCLYVSHPNGYTTVYAHLIKFNDSIQQYVKNQQYKTEEFEQEIRPEPDKFLFKKGEIIGYSGNTGGSKAPHLHFEIRETITENAVNPLLMLDVDIQDHIFPIVKAIRIYPKDSNSCVRVIYKNGIKNEAGFGGYVTLLAVGTGNGKFAIKSLFQIQGKGNLALGIRAIDHIQDMASTVSPYSIDMCVEGERYFCQNLEKLDFAKLKYINAHTDYQDWIQNGRWFERSHSLPNDSLEIYEVKTNNGVIELKTPETKINYYIKDIAGNTSELDFSILLTDLPLIKEKPKKINPLEMDKAEVFKSNISYDKEFELDKGNFNVIIPKGSIYEDAEMSFSIQELKILKPYIFSNIYKLSPSYIPIQKDILIQLKPEMEFPLRIKNKLCLISSKEGFIGGNFVGDKIVGKSKVFTNYWIGIDSTPPKITPLNFRQNGNMTSRIIKASISDDVSGILTFKGYIDGKWVLFQADPKKNLVYHEIDSKTNYGLHNLEFLLLDRKGNEKRVKYSLYF